MSMCEQSHDSLTGDPPIEAEIPSTAPGPRLFLMASMSDKVLALEVDYAKQAEKLELLRQRIQIAKDEGYLAQRKSEVGQLAQRVEAAREDLQRAEQRRIAMQDNYVDKNAQWKIDHRRVMEQLRLAEVADITSDLVSAAQADVELTEGRVTLLRLRIGVLKIQEEVERKEIYLKGLVNTQRAVSQMEDELSNAKQELAFEELQWAEDWDDWTALTVDLSAKVSGKRKDTSFEEDRVAKRARQPDSD